MKKIITITILILFLKACIFGPAPIPPSIYITIMTNGKKLHPMSGPEIIYKAERISDEYQYADYYLINFDTLPKGTTYAIITEIILSDYNGLSSKKYQTPYTQYKFVGDTLKIGETILSQGESDPSYSYRTRLITHE